MRELAGNPSIIISLGRLFFFVVREILLYCFADDPSDGDFLGLRLASEVGFGLIIDCHVNRTGLLCHERKILELAEVVKNNRQLD
jgi:hypothetical protein